MQIIADQANSTAKLDKLAQSLMRLDFGDNGNEIGREIQVACGDDFLQEVGPGGGQEVVWDSIHNKMRPDSRGTVNCKTEKVGNRLGATAFVQQFPNIVMICERGLEMDLIAPGDDLDYVVKRSLSTIIFHEMLHTAPLGRCTSAQRE